MIFVDKSVEDGDKLWITSELIFTLKDLVLRKTMTITGIHAGNFIGLVKNRLGLGVFRFIRELFVHQ